MEPRGAECDGVKLQGRWVKENPVSIISLYISSLFLLPSFQEDSDASSLLKAEHVLVITGSVSIHSSASDVNLQYVRLSAHPSPVPTVSFSNPSEHSYWVHYLYCF